MKKFMKRLTRSVKKFTGKYGKKISVFAAAMSVSLMTMAQTATGFGAGIDSAQSEIQPLFSKVSVLMLAIGGIIGLIGAIRIYIKWNNGDQDVTKSIIAWGGAALFLAISGAVIGAVFGVA